MAIAAVVPNSMWAMVILWLDLSDAVISERAWDGSAEGPFWTHERHNSILWKFEAGLSNHCVNSTPDMSHFLAPACIHF